MRLQPQEYKNKADSEIWSGPANNQLAPLLRTKYPDCVIFMSFVNDNPKRVPDRVTKP
jgi:hypothetical protein